MSLQPYSMVSEIKLKFKNSKFYSIYQNSAIQIVVQKSRQALRATVKKGATYSYLFCRKPFKLRKWKGSVHFLTFGSDAYKHHLERIFKEAKRSGFFDTITIVTDKDLPEDYKSNYSINQFTRGFGYWAWKSYITKSKLEAIAVGDILIYLDAACSINKQGKKRYYEYLDLLIGSKYSSLSFQSNFPEKKYTKTDLFRYFGIQNEDSLKESGQIFASVFLLKKDSYSLELVREWFSICHVNNNLITDLPSKYPNDEEFIDHRHDQSVFSLLRKMKGTISIKNEIWKENLRFPFSVHRFH